MVFEKLRSRAEIAYNYASNAGVWIYQANLGMRGQYRLNGML